MRASSVIVFDVFSWLLREVVFYFICTVLSYFVSLILSTLFNYYLFVEVFEVRYLNLSF